MDINVLHQRLRKLGFSNVEMTPELLAIRGHHNPCEYSQAFCRNDAVVLVEGNAYCARHASLICDLCQDGLREARAKKAPPTLHLNQMRSWRLEVKGCRDQEEQRQVADVVTEQSQVLGLEIFETGRASAGDVATSVWVYKRCSEDAILAHAMKVAELLDLQLVL